MVVNADVTKPAGDRPPLGGCSVATANYLAFARVTAQSFVAHHPGAPFVVLLLDDLAHRLSDDDECFTFVRPEDLPIDPDDYARMAYYYDATELSCAMKPWVLGHLLEQVEVAIYLDADIECFSSLEALAALARTDDIVLTPHVTTPMPRDGLLPDETLILAAGIYNLGFLALGQNSGPFLEFWRSRLIDDGLVDQPAMRQADQRWVDFVPALFRHVIVRDTVYNVAYWNLHERVLAKEGESWTVDGRPLGFFHFSGYDVHRPALLSKHQGATPRITLMEHPALVELCAHYRNGLLAAGVAANLDRGYGFANGPLGPLSPEERLAFLDAVLDARDAGAEPPRVVLTADGPRREDQMRRAETDLATISRAVEPPGALTLTRPLRLSHRTPEPLVTVSIPVYNRPELLAETLDSVLAQTYEELEILVVDNASTDDTVAVAMSYAEKDSRVAVHQNTHNIGSLDNYRRCMELARGEYMKLLCSDDLLAPRAIARLVDAISAEEGLVLATSSRTLIDGDGVPLPVIASTELIAISDVVFDGRELANRMLVRAINDVGEPSTALFRVGLVDPREAFEVGGTTFGHLSDVVTWLRLLVQGDAAYIAEPLSQTRLHDGNAGLADRGVGEHAEWIELIEVAHVLGLCSDPREEMAGYAAVLPRISAALADAPDHPGVARLVAAVTRVGDRINHLRATLGGAAVS
jgi:hypothetical protein